MYTHVKQDKVYVLAGLQSFSVGKNVSLCTLLSAVVMEIYKGAEVRLCIQTFLSLSHFLVFSYAIRMLFSLLLLLENRIS